MPDKINFFIFLIEQYAAYKGTTSGEILKKWDALGITEKIVDNYEIYHI